MVLVNDFGAIFKALGSGQMDRAKISVIDADASAKSAPDSMPARNDHSGRIDR